MIIGLGSDLVSVSRFAGAMERHGERFLERIFTGAELAYAATRRHPAESLAARFAAKEACFKVIGVGWSKRGVRYHDAEVTRAPSGAPGLRVSGRLGELARARGAVRFHLTLTHTEDLAMAVVVAEAE